MFEIISKIALIIHSLGIGGMERVMAVLINHFKYYPKCRRTSFGIDGKKSEIKQIYPLLML